FVCSIDDCRFGFRCQLCSPHVPSLEAQPLYVRKAICRVGTLLHLLALRNGQRSQHIGWFPALAWDTVCCHNSPWSHVCELICQDIDRHILSNRVMRNQNVLPGLAAVARRMVACVGAPLNGSVSLR